MNITAFSTSALNITLDIILKGVSDLMHRQPGHCSFVCVPDLVLVLAADMSILGSCVHCGDYLAPSPALLDFLKFTVNRP